MVDRTDARLGPWQQRQAELAIFTPAEGPKRVARLCLEKNEAIGDTLKLMGLPPTLWQGGFARASFLEMLQLIHAALLPGKAEPMVAIVERFLEHCVDGSALRYPDLRGPLADALLLPFWGQPGSGEDLQGRVQKFLLRSLGDPRLARGSWQGVSEEARQIMMRWLISATLEDFFRILDQVALDHHWRYRRAFWRAYFNHGALDDAWVALGSNALGLARRFFSDGQSYARFERGNDADQCILMMRIGGLTICEWSHMGKCRIWREGDKKAPKLYGPLYRGDELKYSGPDAEFSHMGSENGRWQDRIAEHIEDRTGIQLRRHEYMFQG